MTLTLSTFLIGFVLALVQLVAALPWLLLAFYGPADREALWRRPFSPQTLTRLAVALGVCAAAPLVGAVSGRGPDDWETLGRSYAALLQIQLTVDFFIVGFALLLWLWPKSGAVALAAFREGVRQWLFWLISLGAAVFMFVSV